MVEKFIERERERETERERERERENNGATFWLGRYRTTSKLDGSMVAT